MLRTSGIQAGATDYSEYTYPLGRLLTCLVILYHLYTDDTQLQKSFNPRKPGQEQKARSQLQTGITHIADWMCANKMRLNPEKTEFIVMSSKSNAKRITTDSLELQGERISAVSVVRNLGVHMDCALTLDFHIGYVQRTCYYYLNWIRKIRKYLTKQVAKSIVHALVITRIDYCNSLYVNLPKITTDRLQRIMRSAARIISEPPRNASITEVCKNLHWLPVPERAQFKVLTLVYKSCMLRHLSTFLN